MEDHVRKCCRKFVVRSTSVDKVETEGFVERVLFTLCNIEQV
jgi:hypothetical protein